MVVAFGALAVRFRPKSPKQNPENPEPLQLPLHISQRLCTVICCGHEPSTDQDFFSPRLFFFCLRPRISAPCRRVRTTGKFERLTNEFRCGHNSFRDTICLTQLFSARFDCEKMAVYVVVSSSNHVIPCLNRIQLV